MNKENMKEWVNNLPEHLYENIIGVVIVGSTNDSEPDISSRYHIDFDYEDSYDNNPRYVVLSKLLQEVAFLGADLLNVKLSADESWDIKKALEKVLNKKLKKCRG